MSVNHLHNAQLQISGWMCSQLRCMVHKFKPRLVSFTDTSLFNYTRPDHFNFFFKSKVWGRLEIKCLIQVE